MRRSPIFILALVACIATLSVAGCNQAEMAGPPKIETAPKGFAKIPDASKLPKGTQLFEANGKPFATVLGHTDNHTFPNGKTGKGTQLQMDGAAPAGPAGTEGAPAPGGAGSFWLPDEIIVDTKCVKG